MCLAECSFWPTVGRKTSTLRFFFTRKLELKLIFPGKTHSVCKILDSGWCRKRGIFKTGGARHGPM